MVDLGLGKGGIARPAHRRVGRNLANLPQRVRADELSLTVEVRADHDGVGLLGKVLQRANDALFGRELLDGRPYEVRQARNLPALDVDAVLEEGLPLAVVRRARKAIRQICRQMFTLGGQAVPALLLVKLQLGREVGGHDVAAKADGDPFIPVMRKAIDGSVVDLVGLWLARL